MKIYYRYLTSIVLALFFLQIMPGFASNRYFNQTGAFDYPFYVGLEGGYGSTTWIGLVPALSKQNMAIDVSTPIRVQEGGSVWGAFLGYEIMPQVALEANYMHYPDAHVTFDDFSIFAFDHNGNTTLITHTEVLSLMAKIMMIIPCTPIRAYSSLGAAGTRRSDILNQHWRVTPTFGAGFNYDITPHVMLELAGNYTAGFGESELDPSNDYMPFLYSVALRLAYRF